MSDIYHHFLSCFKLGDFPLNSQHLPISLLLLHLNYVSCYLLHLSCYTVHISPDFPFTGSPIRAIDCGLLQFANQGRALSKGSRVLLWPSIITEGFHRGHRCLMKQDPFKGPFEQPFPCLTFLWPRQVKTSVLSGCSLSWEPRSRREEGADIWHFVKGVMYCGPCGQRRGLNDLPGIGL